MLGISGRTWLLLTVILLFSPLCDLLDDDDKYFHNDFWFFYLIFTIIIVFKKGKLYGLVSTAVESIIFLLIELSDEQATLNQQEWLIFFTLLFLNIIVSLTIGTLVKEKMENHIELVNTKNLLESIFNHLDIAIWSDNLKEKMLLSKGMEQIYGLKREEAEDQFWKESIHPEDHSISRKIEEKLQKHESFEFEYRILRPDGEIRWIRDRGIPVLNEQKELVRFDGVVVDITDKIEAKAELEFLAYHDGLTGLPNMNYLNHLLISDFYETMRLGHSVCVMFFNLDRFKLINDSFGHRTGDHLLKMISNKLVHLLPENGKVIRAGGDDFIFYLPKMNRVQGQNFVRLLLSVFSQPFQLDEQEIRIAASIGIAIPGKNDTLEVAVQKASAALHFAKEYGRNQYRFYSRQFWEIANRRLQLEQRLKAAVEQNLLELYYQPKLHLTAAEIKGMEALARWNDPVLGPVSPAEFIPLAEETGMIIPLGKWVLETACRQTKELQKKGYPPLNVCVNISSRQFLQHDFVKMIEQILQDSNLAPEFLNLEITERIALYNIDDAILKLTKLKNLGVSISLDDFGTGYSSLSYIKSLPIDYLKIDRAFINGIVENKQDADIIQSIISLAHTLHFNVVAEGVENKKQLTALADMQCDEIQGFYFAQPMSLRQLHQFLADMKEKTHFM